MFFFARLFFKAQYIKSTSCPYVDQDEKHISNYYVHVTCQLSLLTSDPSTRPSVQPKKNHLNMTMKIPFEEAGIRRIVIRPFVSFMCSEFMHFILRVYKISNYIFWKFYLCILLCLNALS